MSWHDYSLARTYLAETRVGARVREAKRAEDAQARRSKKALAHTR